MAEHNISDSLRAELQESALSRDQAPPPAAPSPP